MVKSEGILDWVSLFFLLFVTLLPFTTAFLSEHIHFRFSIGLYWLNIFILGLLGFIHSQYAIKHKLISIPEDEEKIVHRGIIGRLIIAQSLYAASALLCFINTYLSIGAIIIIQLNYALAFFYKTKKQEEDKK